MHLRLLLLATTTAAFLPPQHAIHKHTKAYLTPVEKALASGDAESVVTALEDTTTDLSRTLAAACLDRACAVAAAPDGSGAAAALRSEEDRLARCYEALRARGLASRYGVGITRPWPVTRRGVTPEFIAARTRNLTLASFRPSEGAGPLWWVLGSVLSIAEILLSKKLGMDSPQPLFLGTAALVLADQVAFKGAVGETVAAAANSEYSERIVRHEAGHVLLAYLLGCPVQGCVLSAREALADDRAAALNGAAGTAFFDAELNAAARSGAIKRSVLDRYTIVVMGGIAAEAMCYGDSQGGKDDEGALIQFLQETVGGFLGSDDPAGEVANQARWAALNGLLLLRDHRAEFDRLVAALEATRARSIGTVMLAIEDGATPLEALAA